MNIYKLSTAAFLCSLSNGSTGSRQNKENTTYSIDTNKLQTSNKGWPILQNWTFFDTKFLKIIELFSVGSVRWKTTEQIKKHDSHILDAESSVNWIADI